MLKCNYCNRIFKRNYTTCPGCGASSFKEHKHQYEQVIKTPPEGGYKIDYENFKKHKRTYGILCWVGIGMMLIFIVPEIISLFAMSFFEAAISFSFNFLFFLMPLGISFLLIFLGKSEINRTNKKIEKLKRLANTGVLIKNLKYDVVSTGVVIMGRSIYAIKIEYVTESGVKIPLTSEGKYDDQLSRDDGTVDLLIDPNDHSNFYIDFEIY